MKKMMMFGLALMLAFTMSIPTIFAQQQDTKPAQTNGWHCPMMNQANQGGWNCPMMNTGAQGGWRCPMMGHMSMGGGMMMGRGCMMYHNQAQSATQQ